MSKPEIPYMTTDDNVIPFPIEMTQHSPSLWEQVTNVENIKVAALWIGVIAAGTEIQHIINKVV